MRQLSILTQIFSLAAAKALPRLDQQSLTGATVARPGGVEDISLTKHNTLNGTYGSTGHAGAAMKMASLDGFAAPIPFEFVKRYEQDQVKAYISGFDVESRIVFVRGDGSFFYPSSQGSGVPIEIDNSQIAISLPEEEDQPFRVNIPAGIRSGRVYFSEGPLRFFMVKIPGGDGLVQPSVASPTDPSAETNWGFIEFTYNPDGSIWTNLSYVDFAGFLLGMALTDDDGNVQSAKGLSVGAVSEICKRLAQQAQQDGRRWAAMCITNGDGVPVRVLSPNLHTSLNSTDFEDYWQPYVDSVWERYSTKTLSVSTSHIENHGLVKCKVGADSVMTCGTSGLRYEKPLAKDIWGCDSGTFARGGNSDPIHLALIARLCAAFVRSTLLLKGGDLEPNKHTSHLYYTTNPTNHYSRLIHEYEVDGRGYAFPYDDVNPSGQDASGSLVSGNPSLVTVYLGGADEKS